mmetsp:Transcript_17096/g.25771  ORF Transcript_17096/g.25771 Transcript_17096/m.25771 type:complete len:83 (+) Transcript_17096:1266-1514(+)
MYERVISSLECCGLDNRPDNSSASRATIDVENRSVSGTIEKHFSTRVMKNRNNAENLDGFIFMLCRGGDFVQRRLARGRLVW